MPPRIVLVHNVPEFVNPTVSALQAAGYDEVTCVDTMSAIDALDAEERIDILITRVQFLEGQPHGVALGRMARVKRPSAEVLFVGGEERLEHTKGVGELG